MSGCGLGERGCASSPEDPSWVAPDFEETPSQSGAIHTRRERRGARTQSAGPFLPHGGTLKHGSGDCRRGPATAVSGGREEVLSGGPSEIALFFVPKKPATSTPSCCLRLRLSEDPLAEVNGGGGPRGADGGFAAR